MGNNELVNALTPENFQQILKGFKKKEEFGLAAEVAFALAKFYHETGDTKKAARFKSDFLDILQKRGSDTLEACGTSHIEILGISIPALLHDGTAHFDF
ncbi:MAG: hypothetical protein HYT27_01960 [Parcubacteria group bacterium]|nr:hypothetical protein [Parcubacteria group bacterium]